MLTSKKSIYVGGLSEEVDLPTLQSIFTSFGDVVDVKLPVDVLTGKHRGYAFVEYKEQEDAEDAMDNMHESEIFGRTIRVSLAKGRVGSELGVINKHIAVWNSEEWIEKYSGKSTVKIADDKTTEENIMLNEVYPSNTEKVFMDISIDGQYTGRMVFQLRNDVVPKTAYNFRRLCQAKRGEGFKQSIFHRIISEFMAQGGDYTNFNGTGGKSIFGNRFEDENFIIKHTKPGDLSMANSGPGTNGSQFFITFTKTNWLDGKHVVFGHLESGIETLNRIESVGSKKGKPLKRVVIEDCGQLL